MTNEHLTKIELEHVENVAKMMLGVYKDEVAKHKRQHNRLISFFTCKIMEVEKDVDPGVAVQVLQKLL